MKVSDLGSVTTKKDQRQLPKRVVTLTDESNASVDLTLWGDQAVNCTLPVRVDFNSTYLMPLQVNHVVAVKSVRVSEFGGRSLNAINSSYFVVHSPSSTSLFQALFIPG